MVFPFDLSVDLLVKMCVCVGAGAGWGESGCFCAQESSINKARLVERKFALFQAATGGGKVVLDFCPKAGPLPPLTKQG